MLLEEEYGERRADITLRRGTTRYHVELKAPNTNWRIPGVTAKHRPVTRNIAGIVVDARKLAASPGQGIVCFVLFPVPSGDHWWSAYLARIAGALNIPLSEAEHCARVAVPLGETGLARWSSARFSVQQGWKSGRQSRLRNLRPSRSGRRRLRWYETLLGQAGHSGARAASVRPVLSRVSPRTPACHASTKHTGSRH